MSRFDPDGRRQPGTRYLVPARAGYVRDRALARQRRYPRRRRRAPAKEALFEQYAQGIEAVIARSRPHGMVPIVTLCYTRNDFTASSTATRRRMNARINSWDVPSVNLLGAVDDGTGKWADGFWRDSLHPNAAGHAELATTFVPSLFEALERGKPTAAPPRRGRASRGSPPSAALTFTPDAAMHPFALGLTVRAGGDGPIATVAGAALDAATGSKTVTRAGQAPVTIRSIDVEPG